MKNVILWLLLMNVTHVAFAQVELDTSYVVSKKWHYLDPVQDTVYGISLYKAYDFLSTFPQKRKCVVAVIDGGGELDHVDLKNVLWTNKGEIPGNGIDDDNNGYIDDVHGWNFLGKPDGTTFQDGISEGDREFLKLSHRYFGRDPTMTPEQRMYFGTKVIPNSNFAKGYLQATGIPGYVKYIEDFCTFISTNFRDKQEVSVRKAIEKMQADETLRKDRERYNAFGYFVVRLDSLKNVPLDQYEEHLVQNFEKWGTAAITKLNEDVKKGREIEAEKIDPVTNKRYQGNGNLASLSMEHGTHVGGIIGADRHNNSDFFGIADVELMFVRVLAGKGCDEEDQDVANAIRYAVDNGANIINMSFGKFLSIDPKSVEKALEYAKKKGVMVVMAAGNETVNRDVVARYPQCNSKSENIIVVGASDPRGMTTVFSNFGKKTVHVFAPGFKIYSAFPGSSYKELSGTSMAAPVVTGIVALLWNYFPELKPKDLKKIILDTGIEGAKWTVRRRIDADKYKELSFKDMSVTGKIVNAENAVKKAAEIAAKKK